MTGAIEAVLKRDRALVATMLVLIAALSWVTTVRLASDMSWMMLDAPGWDAGYFGSMFLMWVVMMGAMMLPSAAPTILLFAALERQASVRRTMLFTAGYLACWTAFSLVATLVQWVLDEAGQLASPMSIRATPAVGALLLMAAGIYQVTALKNTCLMRCRSPAEFLADRWRAGRFGAFLMGLVHGAYCVGCCWVLMALLFVAGAMNLLWVATLAAFVLAEKVAPAGALIGRVGAVAMIGAGAVLLGSL